MLFINYLLKMQKYFKGFQSNSLIQLNIPTSFTASFNHEVNKENKRKKSR